MAEQELGVEDALRLLLQALPQVAAGLKRPGIPPELQGPFSSLGPRHIPALSYLLLDGPMSVGELAGRLGLALPTTSLMVRELSQQGLVERSEDPGDRRRTLVRISNDRAEVIQSWLTHRAEPIRATLQQLTPAERHTFSHAMQLLARAFTATDDPGPQPSAPKPS
jgi:DNA-binding MarR family transcriptional regulator